MPNWCKNELKVSGFYEDLKEFDRKFKGKPCFWGLSASEKQHLTEKQIAEKLEKIKKDHDALKERYCLNALYPVPEEIARKGYSKIGYNWCWNNWDTKWDIYWQEVSVIYPFDFNKKDNKKIEGSIIYVFDTAWSPVEKWLKKVSRDFPKLIFTLKYIEVGAAFVGQTTYIVGKAIEKYYAEYIVDAELYYKLAYELFGYNLEDLEEDEEL